LKRLFLIFLAVATLSSGGIIFSPIAQAAEDVKGAHVVAYYFHGQMRCPTCHKLEQYSKEAIEANFKNELSSGELVFRVINIDEKENQHFVNDYQLYTKSLVISLVKNGKEVKSENLTKIWDYVGDKQKFIDYVKAGVADFLKEAK
jgi:Zn-dependent alcohol dehydrogenase